MRELILQWHDNGRPTTYTVTDQRPIVLGRRADCDIVLTARTVSRQHATIFAYQGIFYVRNVSQHNPVYVNGQRLIADLPLNPGDVLQLSDVPLQVLTIQEAQPWQQPQIKVRCVTCQNVVDANLRDCPWCGSSLAHGVTVYV